LGIDPVFHFSDGKIIAMDLQKSINSPQAGLMALRICKILPPGLGKGFARIVADQIAARKNLPLVKAIRLNRYVVSGCQFGADELDQAVRASIRHLGESYYTLFHNINNPAGLEKHIHISPELEAIVERSQKNERGLIILGVHLSNFDLVLQAAGWRGLKAAALTLPEETENKQGVEWQHQFRRLSGLELLPASFANIRQSIKRLEQGGVVLTGVDRPIRSPKYRPLFFNRPSNLPVHYVTLGVASGAPLVVLSAVRQTDGKYHIRTSEEFYMTPDPDRQKELLVNAEKVLELAEDRIREAPEQWNIFQQVWEGLEAELP
jgi:lauroyl/myristoyl acyltransferase